jgi:response regulator RpfG family c-di-GMP phosphodiesterase
MARTASETPKPAPHAIRVATPPAQVLLAKLLESCIVLTEDWELLPTPVRQKILQCASVPALLSSLEEHELLTAYQRDRIATGTTHGLILGSYRVLDRLGAGAMGIVFKAEHFLMRRIVAIKVLPMHSGQDSKHLLRFLSEMRAVAQLQHPNIVAAIDAGEVAGQDPDAPVLHYFAMEYVPGQDLEEYVTEHGPMSVTKACDLAYQIASALAEAHKHNLVHRDIKPSNILVTPEDQAKLLDFGLARHFRHRHTEPGVILGTIDYMSPEQAQDASSVDIRADLYALGGTLFWSLTGESPFPASDTLVQAVTRRLQQQPPAIRLLRPSVPVQLEAVLARMMALKPEDRCATPQVVMQALLPFLKPEHMEHLILSPRQAVSESGTPAGTRPHRILVVDDEASIRTLCRCVLESEGYLFAQANDGLQAIESLSAESRDLVLLDIDMPEMNGAAVLRRLREQPPTPNLKVIMFSGRSSPDEMASMLLAGADGCLTKPFSRVQLVGQVKAVLRLKDAQDRSDLLNHRLLEMNGKLERNLGDRDGDLVHARNALVLALATLVTCRDGETGAHVWRLQRYSRCLAENASVLPSFAGQIDAAFLDMLECCSPLHDIGKVGIPDHILLKPGKLTQDERMLMQSHTVIGADTLTEVAQHHGFALAFLHMAIDITRHHHERFDGTGYPDRLAGCDIPLAARIVAIGDVYDALRSRRVYKPALSHSAALQIMTQGSAGHFDPALMRIFERCADEFDKIFRELKT